ncbi:hypothetical protein PR048_031209 [Dryococelus australis]|uniref:Uncharacterized protein n=1 Tax=Dryococelus australis TaxID=614101 RepID=A0ABQ9G5C3_9NEOP|nr:hypothetical protein PR048_031209 [Dryococelus australis]
MATWNSRVVKQHEQELGEFLQRKQIQIMAFTETYLKAGDTLQINNFVLQRNNCPGEECIPVLSTKSITTGLRNIGKTRSSCARESLTRYPDTELYKPDVLDVTIYKNTDFTYELKVLQELHSDNLPTLLLLDNTSFEATQYRQILNYKKANWTHLNETIARKIPCDTQLATPTEVQEYTTQLTKTVQEAIKVAIQPITIIKCKALQHLRTEVNSLKKEIKHQISLQRAMEWDAKGASLATADNTL